MGLNLAESFIAIHDIATNQTEHITFPDQTPGQNITPGGFDAENGLYYVLVNDVDTSGYYSGTTRISVLDIHSRNFIRIHTLPGTYLFGVYDSKTSLIYLTGPHDPVTRDTNNQSVPIQHVSIFDPHTNQILDTIPIDSRIRVGAKIFM